MPNTPALSPYLAPETGGALNNDFMNFMVGMRQGGIFGGMQAVQKAKQDATTNQVYGNLMRATPEGGEQQQDPAALMRHRGQLLMNAGFIPQGKAMLESANALSPHETFTTPMTALGPDGKPVLVAPGSRGSAKPMQGFSPYERGDEAELNRILDNAGIKDVTQRQAIFTQLAQKKATHQPPIANVNVGPGLAGKVSDIATEGRAAANGAVDIVNTVQRVGDALQGGNVNLGPGSTVLNKIDQVAQILGVGGESTNDRLVNTRNVIRGLAQFTVSARKALKGQGQVSDYEGKLLTRAESGEINDFTIPELKDFLKVTDRLARKAHSEHKRIVGVMGSSKDEAVRGLVPYFDIPDLPPAPKDGPAAPAAKVRKYNPATGRIE